MLLINDWVLVFSLCSSFIYFVVVVVIVIIAAMPLYLY